MGSIGGRNEKVPVRERVVASKYNPMDRLTGPYWVRFQVCNVLITNDNHHKLLASRFCALLESSTYFEQWTSNACIRAERNAGTVTCTTSTTQIPRPERSGVTEIVHCLQQLSASPQEFSTY